MTTANVLWALGFCVFYLTGIGAGVWVTIRFTRANRQLTDLQHRFYRDEDINDAADMSTDDRR